MKDITQKQFDASMKRRGFKLVEIDFLGALYVSLGGGLQASMLNAPEPTRRSRLAYLIREQRRWDKRQAAR